MQQAFIDPDLSVDEVMRRWPATIAVFIRHRMACVGCPAGAFHSLADGSAEHAIPLATLLDQLAAVITPPSKAAPAGPRRCRGERADHAR